MVVAGGSFFRDTQCTNRVTRVSFSGDGLDWTPLVPVLGDQQWLWRVTWHDACHGLRELGLKEEPRALLAAVEGLELVELASAEECCGFGGTFSVKFPELSVAMLDRKLEQLDGADVEAIVSGDVSCLMQISGRLQRRGSSVRALHLAEILAGGAR